MTAFRIGDVQVHRVVELESSGGTRFLLPQATPEAVHAIEWLRPDFADEEGQLHMSIHSWVLESPSGTILVDTGLGNDKQRQVPVWHQRQGPFLQDLEAAGFPAGSIDLVVCTHLHVDHVGWNTVLRDGEWVPTFPGARYLFGRVEWEHWSQREEEVYVTLMNDSVRPIVDAERAEFFEMNQQLTPELRAEPSPGHSIGHTSLWIESKGQRALIAGDFLHHPAQAARLEWCSSFDHDPAQAIATRKRLLPMLADEEVPLLGMHWAKPVRVVRDGDAFLFRRV